MATITIAPSQALERERAKKMGIRDPRKKYAMEDMVRGDLPVCRHRLTARRRALQGQSDRNRNSGDALCHRHGTLDPRRPSLLRQVPTGLTFVLLIDAVEDKQHENRND